MLGYVYALRRGGIWEARLTIEPDVDYFHWFGEEGGGGKAEAAWLWREPLPLGQAARAAELWSRVESPKFPRWLRAAIREPAPTALYMTDKRALEELAAAIRYARMEGEAIAEAAQHGRRRKRIRPRAGAPFAWELFGRLAERWERSGARLSGRSAAGGRESSSMAWCVREGGERSAPRAGRGLDRASAGAVAATAKLAAALLQGRSLLGPETRDMLVDRQVPYAEQYWSKAVQLAALLGQVSLSGAVVMDDGFHKLSAPGVLRCLRCGSGECRMHRTPCASCGRLCAYCEACLTMGRSKECELLVRGIIPPLLLNREKGRQRSSVERCPDNSGFVDSANISGRIEREEMVAAPGEHDRLQQWGLSPAQQAAAAEALRFVERREEYGAPLSVNDGGRHVRSALWKGLWSGVRFRGAGGMGRYTGEASMPADRSRHRDDIRNFLLWAVTGAGKTEMIFPLIASVMRRGGRVLVASPRRDVVLELDPRIRKAFPDATVATLYGGSGDRWERGQITLATTHQLFRFHQAFDLVIVDEIDAFPYAGDERLRYAADKCCLYGVPRLLLSATPSAELQRAARQGKLAYAKVPARFHRHPLPVPLLYRCSAVGEIMKSQRLPESFVRQLERSLDRGAQIFVFVARIGQTAPFAALLRRRFQGVVIDATSSVDEERARKVRDFRDASVRLLVTTTILERGVTIAQSDVFVMDADAELFDEASLVQMAGRAGRSAADPDGKVFFFAKERNAEQIRAVRHIRSMNRMARKNGYLDREADQAEEWT